jgi:genome maintenance exonuclease 1
MTIELNFWENKEYNRVVVDGVRHYDIEGNYYPSVTSVTSAYGKAGIDKWRKKVGEEEANRICNTASANGTYIHHLAEQYILGNTIDHSRSTYLQKMIFGNLKTNINKISEVNLLENTLFSHKLKLAGTVDCVGVYDGKLSIIDFKTAKAEKKESWVESYIVQTTIYSMMVYEMYGIKIRQIVLLFACSDLTTPIIVKTIDKDLLELVKKYIEFYRNAK